VLSCQKETRKVFFDTGYIVGFDPCTGAYSEDSRKGFVIITLQSKDTLLTYNLPSNIIGFPKSFFQSYKDTFLFPDSVKYNYKINLSYSFVDENEKIASFCFGDIYQGDFISYVHNKQIQILSAEKIVP
jgi:hypothetical protein